MEVFLYAEVYLICIIVLGIVALFMPRSSNSSNSDRWFKILLAMFLLNFFSNLFFKLVSGNVIFANAGNTLSYAFKTAYHITLCAGVFAWCGYADSARGSGVFQKRTTLRWLLIPLLVPIIAILLNLQNHLVFEISATGAYTRHILFQAEMCYLLVFSLIMAVRLIRRTRREADPIIRKHMYLTASFPLCIALAWIMSFVGEAFPVICVCITAEILCLYIGGVRNEVSMDKLTQVNNRQNLIGYMDYKEKNNDGNLFLLMIDVDDFKQVNDTYGHVEGDEALVSVAGVLKRACGPFPKRPYIARYGGDEFIVIAESEDGGIDALVAAIEGELANENDKRDDYKLHLSIGVVPWQQGLNHNEVIDQADREMYRMKRSRKESRNPLRSITTR